MPLAYYGVKLSDNWVETPEGYFVFKNAVIGRTGFQTYKGHELDRDELALQDIQVGDEDDVELFRSPEEVFSPKTIASFQGKSVTDGHPSDLLSIENVQDHEEGQVFNVHEGKEALESGDFPLLADLMVKSKSLIDKIRSGLRELSCGYNYHVLRDGKLIKQIDIVGNHVAIVTNARAGREAVIVDAATPSIERFNIMNFLDTVLNRNSKSKIASWAKDSKPEEIADVIAELSAEIEKRSQVVTRVSVAKDVKTAVDGDAVDNAADRKRMHDALDRTLDGVEEKEEESKAADRALRDLFKGRASDAQADAAVDQEEEKEEGKKKKEGEDEAADEEEEEGEDEAVDQAAALTIEPEDRPKPSGAGADEIRAARQEGAEAVLRSLKPHIAKSGIKKLISAYDTTAKAVKGNSYGKTSDGYGRFQEAAVSRSKAAQDSVSEAEVAKKRMESYSALEKLYSDRFVGTKR